MSALWKDLFREMKHTMGRFLSLLLITALGAMSVVGIQASSINMRAIADKTYKEHNLYDLQIKSTTGFTEDDIVALMDTEGVSAVMPTNIFDVYIKIVNENRAVRTYTLPGGMNTIDILEGRLPENPGECVIERRLLNDGNIKIGDSIRLGLDNMVDYDHAISNDTFTVVGVVASPLYITFQRGNTSLGDGSLQYYRQPLSTCRTQ
jgi:putative ABC transport system permease protein